MQFAAISQFESEQKYLLPLAAFCGKIMARTQKANYICNTDPSNPALSKSQIFNDVCTIHFHKETIRNSVILFVSLFYPFLPLYHHKICHMIFPNTVQEPLISINSKTQQKSVTVSFTKFLIMIKCLYLQNPLFHFPHNSE